MGFLGSAVDMSREVANGGFSDKPAQMEGFPMKEWTVELYLLDQDDKEHPAKCFTKAVYHLHFSFEEPDQSKFYFSSSPLPLFIASAPSPPLSHWQAHTAENCSTNSRYPAYTEPPFKCTNEGWGEFEMTIDLYTTEKGGKITVPHDLNFAAATYEHVQNIQFKNPSQALQQTLRETGPLPSDEERKSKKADVGKKKKSFDVEKMAESLVKLGEEDLLQVIQMIHDGKDDSTYVQNNIDGE